ncbi:MAG: hypothetical protein K2V38_01615, partial [Gemmataceae bacterium]|nr:hypothetical protein [Gemmataceae bacterium]
LIGPEPPPDTFGNWDDWDSDEPVPRPRKGSARKIPTPSTGGGMLVCLCWGGSVVVVGFVAAALGEVLADDADLPRDWGQLLLFVIALPVPFGMLTLAVKSVLPTTGGRAVLVAVLAHLIGLFVALFAGALIAFVWAVVVA